MNLRFTLTNPSFEVALKEFASNIENLGYGKTTRKVIPSCVKEFLFKVEEIGISEFKDIDSDFVKEHYSYLSIRPKLTGGEGALSGSMINFHLYSIRLFFNYLEQNYRIRENPISGLEFEKAEYQERQILTVEEIKELYAVTETLRDKALLGIFYGCGLRRSEVEKLNVSDINFKKSLLYVREGKGSKRRVIPMSRKVCEDLKNYYFNERPKYIKKKNNKDQEAFLLNDRGRRMKGGTFDNRSKYLINKTLNPIIIGKKISLHNYRHSIATHLLENGMSIHFVQSFLGHLFAETTQIYTRVTKTLMKRI